MKANQLLSELVNQITASRLYLNGVVTPNMPVTDPAPPVVTPPIPPQGDPPIAPVPPPIEPPPLPEQV